MFTTARRRNVVNVTSAIGHMEEENVPKAPTRTELDRSDFAGDGSDQCQFRIATRPQDRRALCNPLSFGDEQVDAEVAFGSGK